MATQIQRRARSLPWTERSLDGMSIRSVCLRRARARCGRTGPAISSVFAQNAADQQNHRKNDPLNGSWGHRECLCVLVPPQHVGQVKD